MVCLNENSFLAKHNEESLQPCCFFIKQNDKLAISISYIIDRFNDKVIA